MSPAIKGGIILSLSLIASLLFLSSVTGQVRQPGVPGGGAMGRPPGFTGGATGAATGMRPGAIGGAIGGTSNIGGPRAGAIGGINGGVGGVGGGLTGIGGTQWVYTCTVCGKEVLRSNTPRAGVKNCCVSPVGGRGVIGVRARVGNTNLGGGGGVNPPIQQPPVTNPPVQPFSPPPSTSTSTSSSETTTTSPSGISGLTLVIGIGVVLFGLVLLGGVIVLIVQSQKGGAAPRRRRPRNDYY